MTTDEQALKLLAIAEKLAQDMAQDGLANDAISADNAQMHVRGSLFGALVKLSKAKPVPYWQDATMHVQLTVGFFTFSYCHTPAKDD